MRFTPQQEQKDQDPTADPRLAQPLAQAAADPHAGDKHTQIGPRFPHADVKPGAPMDGEVFPVILPR